MSPGSGPRRRKPPVLRSRLAAAHLGAHPAMGPWVARIGPLRLPRVTDDAFTYLVRAIVYQQLAGAAASTIHGRVVGALGGVVTPRSVGRVADEVLRSAGLSAGKLAAIRDLAARTPELHLEELPWLDDTEVERRLTSVRGIGPWTAQMYLIFALRRPDVWPAGDLGVRQGYARIHALPEAPTQKEMPDLGEAYRPWRSAAAWYCWRALETDL